MAEIKNYTMNFSCGHTAVRRCLTGSRRLACAEVQCLNGLMQISGEF